MSFADLGLSEDTLRAVGEAGYTEPTPIQAAAIPTLLMGRDMVGVAQTGTGKTASFTLPMIDILAAGRTRARMPRSLILEPTRELAAQVAENFDKYGKYHRLSKALLIGGERFTEQEKALDKGVDVLIATPGRLLDLFQRGKILMSDVKIFVIDEADRMLDMGFIPDIELIASKLPVLRQTVLFSATMPKEIRRLAEQFLSNPKEIEVARPASPATNVQQSLVMVGRREEKRATLRALLRSEDVKNAFIFCNRKRDVDVLYRSLKKHGFDAEQLHGDLTQAHRTEVLDKFRRNEVSLLVCSDVAARGIDISGMSHVFNFDVPSHADDYVHRIGRTGRAGLSGRAISLATSEDAKYLAAIEKLIGTSIERQIVEGIAPEPAAEATQTEAPERQPRASGRREHRARRPADAAPATPALAVPQPMAAQPIAHSPSVETWQPDSPQPDERYVRERERQRLQERRPRQDERPRHDERVRHDERPRHDERARRDDDRDEQVIGFGTQTPLFLLRDPMAGRSRKPADEAA
jgi:superfamily II DNA/RNA helicase